MVGLSSLQKTTKKEEKRERGGRRGWDKNTGCFGGGEAEHF